MNEEIKEPSSALNIAKYLLSLDPNREYFTNSSMGNFRLNTMLHISQMLHCAKYGEVLFKEPLIAYPPKWHLLPLEKQEELTRIMNDKTIKNRKPLIADLYKGIKLERKDKELLGLV